MYLWCCIIIPCIIILFINYCLVELNLLNYSDEAAQSCAFHLINYELLVWELV